MSRSAVLVNALTFSRPPLIFLWLLFALLEEFCGGFVWGAAATFAMFLSGLTDAFDGWLARRWNVVSPLGKMADPLMDKVFYVVVFPSLTWLAMHQGEGEGHALVLLAFTILYILRDLWVTFLRSVVSLYGGDCAAMWLGKVRTALSFPAAGWVYLYLFLHPALPARGAQAWLATCYAVECAMIALNMLSFFTYTRAYAPYLKKALEQNRNL